MKAANNSNKENSSKSAENSGSTNDTTDKSQAKDNPPASQSSAAPQQFPTTDKLEIISPPNSKREGKPVESQKKPSLESKGDLIKTLALGEQKKDYYGTSIDKAKKQHHITFRDVVRGQAIADIKEVESFKEFNVLIETNNAQCSCCVL